ncbi:MAG: deoxynucleoside kinase [Gammaproteobacteria bacterium]|nr:deoxynucleoside kinase [Gammaproteobacteria bacterium]MCW8923293.1 deoxynucleoside kinase [Gammaproteobacteria bacterium]
MNEANASLDLAKPWPEFVVVEGPIGVGKTTLAKKLSRSFESNLLLEGADDNPFLERFYENPRVAALPTQLHFLLQRARQLKEMKQEDMFSPVRVADFLIEKDRLFAELTLDEDELDLYEQVYATLTIDVPKPDLVVYLQAPVEVLLERIYKRGLSHEQMIEAAYLQRLCDAYVSFFYQYAEAPLLIVNAADIDFANNEDEYQLLLARILANRSGRNYFNPSSVIMQELDL